MDSTFMGTMAGLALRLRELGEGHLQVVHCGQRSRDLLSGLGLDQLFRISSNGASAPQCQELEKSAVGKQEQAQQMLDAHQALCDAAPENLPRFKDVLEYLKQDLQPKAPAK
jgi:anti-sigma B factor antagonist